MKNRLLLELEGLRKDVNRNVINPLIPELGLDNLEPILRLVARARADYIKEFVDLANQMKGAVPSVEQIRELRNRRIIFEELVDAMNALETVIQREYIDVISKRKSSNNQG